MTELENIISDILTNYKISRKSTTYQMIEEVFKRLLRMADEYGFTEPHQALFDMFSSDSHGSKDRRAKHRLALRKVDMAAQTHFVTPEGTFYNNPELPDKEETDRRLEEMPFPIESIDLSYLIVRVLSELRELGLSESSLGQYLHSLRLFQVYCMRQQNSMAFSNSLCNAFLDENKILLDTGMIQLWRWKINRKAIYVLMEVAVTGHYSWKFISTDELEFKDRGLETIRREYLESHRNENFKQATIELRDYVFRTAFRYGGIDNLSSLERISPETVQLIIMKFSEKCSLSSMGTILNALRNILKYLWSNGYIDEDRSGCVLKPFSHKCNVASYISHEDGKRLLQVLDDSPLRDKAMNLMALNLGMRGKDICNLRFNEIDWHSDRIRIHQSKSGEPLTLPLTEDVGNAIVDYVLNERPKLPQPSAFVFLSRNAPFHRLNKLYHICRRAIDKAGITPINGEHKGSHLLRYTMVNRLLEKQVPHQVITDALGHSAKDSDKNYITMEPSMLRLCAIDLKDIGLKHWGEAGLDD
jgi:integrase